MGRDSWLGCNGLPLLSGRFGSNRSDVDAVVCTRIFFGIGFSHNVNLGFYRFATA